jgi:hypothetical protein
MFTFLWEVQKRKALISLLCHVLKPIYKLTHTYILPL